MQWSDVIRPPTDRVARQFAGLWLLVFGCIAGAQFWQGRVLAGCILTVVALVVGIVGLLRPRFARLVYQACMVLVFPIGFVVLNLLLALIFFGMITPLGLFFRLVRRDPLELRPGAEAESYLKAKPVPSVANYYRTF